MFYGNIKNNDIANGLGIRVSLFVSGCRNYCKNCFNKETWDFNYGKEFTSETQDYILDLLSKEHIRGFSLLGGEPFEEENQERLSVLLKAIKTKYPKKDIWVYTGYLYEDLLDKGIKHTKFTNLMLDNIYVLIDGKFEEDLKDLSLKFKGSKNQRIIDVNQTKKEREVVLYNI
ncbi:MAG: anaerobic ribonucleoside-triphosphate reductase activating protein [Anaeroplasmataceae bacterium]